MAARTAGIDGNEEITSLSHPMYFRKYVYPVRDLPTDAALPN